MKISARAEKNLFAVSMAFTMSVIMSFIMALVNFGLNNGFYQVWFNGFWLSFVCALPLSIIFPPIFNKLISLLKSSPREIICPNEII